MSSLVLADLDVEAAPEPGPLGLSAISLRKRQKGAVQSPERFSYEVEAFGRIAVVRQRVRGDIGDQVVAERGAIREWSMKSRLRALKMAYGIDWPERLVMATLTYPGRSESDLLPDTGVRAKLDHQALYARLLREFGQPEALWKLEYQRRGFPHFHDWFGVPWSVSEEEFGDFIKEAWIAVVGSTSEAHREHGTTVERWIGNPGQYVAAYTRKTAAKEYQHRVPDGWEHPGRFWGVWGLQPKREVVAVTTEDYLTARRSLRRYQKSRGRKTVTRGMAGMFAITQGPAAELVARMVNGA